MYQDPNTNVAGTIYDPTRAASRQFQGGMTSQQHAGQRQVGDYPQQTPGGEFSGATQGYQQSTPYAQSAQSPYAHPQQQAGFQQSGQGGYQQSGQAGGVSQYPQTAQGGASWQQAPTGQHQGVQQQPIQQQSTQQQPIQQSPEHRSFGGQLSTMQPAGGTGRQGVVPQLQSGYSQGTLSGRPFEGGQQHAGGPQFPSLQQFPQIPAFQQSQQIPGQQLSQGQQGQQFPQSQQYPQTQQSQQFPAFQQSQQIPGQQLSQGQQGQQFPQSQQSQQYPQSQQFPGQQSQQIPLGQQLSQGQQVPLSQQFPQQRIPQLQSSQQLPQVGWNQQSGSQGQMSGISEQARLPFGAEQFGVVGSQSPNQWSGSQSTQQSGLDELVQLQSGEVTTVGSLLARQHVAPIQGAGQDVARTQGVPQAMALQGIGPVAY